MSTVKRFDQFAKYGDSNYDESNYTSVIDKSKIGKEKEAEAAKLEKEILNDKSSTNVHIQEDRNQIRENDNDEEMYSDVKGTNPSLVKSKFNCYVKRGEVDL